MALTDEGMGTTMLVQPSGGMNYGNMGGGIFGNDGLWLLLVLLLGGGLTLPAALILSRLCGSSS